MGYLFSAFIASLIFNDFIWFFNHEVFFFASTLMFCRRLPNLFRLHATIFACSKMCLCVIYVIVRCCILVPGIYDSDLDPDTLDCWLSFAHSSIRSVCECFTSGSNPLTDKSWKPLYHYELLRHAVKMLLCLQQIYAFYLIDCYKPGVYLFRGSHDRFF